MARKVACRREALQPGSTHAGWGSPPGARPRYVAADDADRWPVHTPDQRLREDREPRSTASRCTSCTTTSSEPRRDQPRDGRGDHMKTSCSWSTKLRPALESLPALKLTVPVVRDAVEHARIVHIVGGSAPHSVADLAREGEMTTHRPAGRAQRDSVETCAEPDGEGFHGFCRDVPGIHVCGRG